MFLATFLISFGFCGYFYVFQIYGHGCPCLPHHLWSGPASITSVCNLYVAVWLSWAVFCRVCRSNLLCTCNQCLFLPWCLSFHSHPTDGIISMELPDAQMPCPPSLSQKQLPALVSISKILGLRYCCLMIPNAVLRISDLAMLDCLPRNFH